MVTHHGEGRVLRDRGRPSIAVAQIRRAVLSAIAEFLSGQTDVLHPR